MDWSRWRIVQEFSSGGGGGGGFPLHWSPSLDYLKGRWLRGHEVPSCLVYIGSYVCLQWGTYSFVCLFFFFLIFYFFYLKWPASVPFLYIYIRFLWKVFFLLHKHKTCCDAMQGIQWEKSWCLRTQCNSLAVCKVCREHIVTCTRSCPMVERSNIRSKHTSSLISLFSLCGMRKTSTLSFCSVSTHWPQPCLCWSALSLCSLYKACSRIFSLCPYT